MTHIAPWLSVRRSREAVEFYKSALGASEIYRLDSDTGVVARLSVDGADFWVSEEDPNYKKFSPETLHGGTIHLVLNVDDPDAAYSRAVAAGACEVCPVTDDHGWRVGRILDPFGHHWEFARKLD